VKTFKVKSSLNFNPHAMVGKKDVTEHNNEDVANNKAVGYSSSVPMSIIHRTK
jgi:hypothetical protein